MKRSLRRPGILIWPAILLLLAWALRGVPLQDIWMTLRGLQAGQVSMLIVFNALIFLTFNLRWWLILRAQGQSRPFMALVVYRLSAFAISYFTPGTQFGGEPWQVHLLQKRQQVPAATALASVTLDKLFELLANFTFLMVGIVLILSGGLLDGLANPGIVAALIVLLALPMGYLLALGSGHLPLTWLVAHLPARLAAHPRFARLGPLAVSTERQMGALLRNKPLVILWILFLSGSIWVLLLAEYWLTFNFLGVRLDALQLVSALTAARLAFLTPLPGGIGALEASQIMVMQALGLPPVVGLGASLLIRARDLTLGGLGLWWLAWLSRSPDVRPLVSQAGD